MSNIERFSQGQAAHRQASVWSRQGQVQRRLEAAHELRLQRIQQAGIEAAADEARILFEDLAYMERLTRFNTETKFALKRAADESKILAGDDPEMQAKFAVLDDDVFGRARFRAGRNDA